MIFIDTNVFLEVVLEREHADACAQLLSRLSQARGTTTDFGIYTIVLTLQRKKQPPEKIQKFLSLIHAIPNLVIYRPTLSDMQRAMEKTRDGMTFDDALVIATMESQGIKKIASLDSDFDSFNEFENVLRPKR